MARELGSRMLSDEKEENGLLCAGGTRCIHGTPSREGTRYSLSDEEEKNVPPVYMVQDVHYTPLCACCRRLKERV